MVNLEMFFIGIFGTAIAIYGIIFTLKRGKFYLWGIEINKSNNSIQFWVLFCNLVFLLLASLFVLFVYLF